ncbi:MAG: PEGA domain-containing protein [Myxococcota bacterium]
MATSVLSLVSVGPAWAGHGGGGGLQLVEEKPDPNMLHAEVLFRAGVRALKQDKADRALALFERALPWKNTSSDLYYNLVQVSKTLKLWDKVVLYAQGFLYREPGSKDSLTMRDDLEAALAECAKAGKVAVAYKFDVAPLETPVLVNNVPMTSTAAMEIRLLPGKYTVTATKEDWNPWSQALVVTAGSAPQVVKGALTPVPAVGKVIIKTTPAEGVEVYQDDVLVGTTPLAGPIELATGRRYLFRFEKSGYDRWWRYIEVYKGESLELAPVMEEAPKTSKAN